MAIFYRRVKQRHLARAFDGEGAMLHGGRWNHVGTRVAYASSSVALATLEVYVHLGDWSVMGQYWVAAVDVPDRLIETLTRHKLPADWDALPAPESTRALGDAWVRSGRGVALRVPSAITPDTNLLIAPTHPDFSKLRVLKPYRVATDPRLAGRRAKRL